jgi:hypothetical protein
MSTTLIPVQEPNNAAQRAPIGAVAALVILALMAVMGAWRLPGLLLQHEADPHALSRVTTSFGVVTVTGHELLDGPSPEELGGVTHGIGGYVDSEHALMRVHLELTGANATIPASAFSLVLPDGSLLAPEMNTLPASTLPDGVSVDTSLSFVLPRGSGDYALQIGDGATSTTMPLGIITAVPRPAAAHIH